ncbi:ankyrin repeat protein SKIP35-like [Lolium rigidum]|uniref:ankyrin repeat protein SKIP35-like n=1 Tax=Lolium rigidum TaxID=89674 RepID=UPI001F5CC430|nr:ankyrin repeat protein SKIP35-like [Lolium rigidum]
MDVEGKMNLEIGSKDMEVESRSLRLEEPLASSEMDMDESGEVDANNNGSSRDCPLTPKGSRTSSKACAAKKPRSVSTDFGDELDLEFGSGERDCGRQQDRKLSRHDRVELSRSFQRAVSSHDWESADNLVGRADAQGLNDVLCVAVDAIWFLSDKEELHAVVALIRRIVSEGANDFTRAALRTSFLASCVSACRGRTTSLADAVSFMGQKLHERLQESHGDEVLKAEASAKVHKFTEWALKCIGLHSRAREGKGRGNHGTIIEVQLQLSAFKTFLDLADNDLTGKDFTEAFDAACFPLTLFSSTFDQGWASGISAAAIQGLLELLVEGGADNVNQCFLEAARYGSTELVRILLQIAQRNSLDIDVDLALGFAAHYGKLETMGCLVQEGNSVAFLGPLMRAAERGCLQVVEWFVNRGCRDMELCLALTAATSSSQVAVAAYLLPLVPQLVLAPLSIEIVKAAGERSTGSLQGVDFLLRSDFLNDPAATYSVADSIAKSADEAVDAKLRSFMLENWSEAAFSEGFTSAQEHFLNMTRIMERGESPVLLRDLPLQLVIAMAYLPLYRECIESGGRLLPQRLRGQLVEAAGRLEGRQLDRSSQGRELLAILEHHLPRFFVKT